MHPSVARAFRPRGGEGVAVWRCWAAGETFTTCISLGSCPCSDRSGAVREARVLLLFHLLAIKSPATSFIARKQTYPFVAPVGDWVILVGTGSWKPL